MISNVIATNLAPELDGIDIVAKYHDSNKLYLICQVVWLKVSVFASPGLPAIARQAMYKTTLKTNTS